MKKYFLLSIFLLFLMFSCIARAAELSTSISTGTQYAPTRNYGFQIICGEISSISNVVFEWNQASNYTASSFVPDTFYYNMSNLAAGNYSYKWYVFNATDSMTFSDTYTVSQNSSSSTIFLFLNGTEGDRNYKRYAKANFTAFINIADRNIRLDSNYTNWAPVNNVSIIQRIANLTENGLFTLTASWNGDQNYTSSSKTFYFDSGPPRFLEKNATPSIGGYIPGAEYRFQVKCKDMALKNVWFESNLSGTFTNYDASSNPSVQNSSDTYWIVFRDLGAMNFSYKWHATDILDEEGNTSYIPYQIVRMNSLFMEITPSTGIREGTEVIVNCYSINQNQLNSSNFVFYRNSELIPNLSASTRLGIFLLGSGTWNFTCATNGSANYSNQTLTKIITVLSGPQPVENRTEKLKITNINFPSLKVGESEETSFYLINDMSKNVLNVTVNLTGIPSDWYTLLSKPSNIYSGEKREVKINLTVPSNAQAGSYSIAISVKGKTTDGKSVSAMENANMMITSDLPQNQTQNQPPSYNEGASNATSVGEALFSIELSDENGLSGYVFSSNMSGEWENDSWTHVSGNNYLVSIAKNTNMGAIIAWKIYANDTNDAWTESPEYVFISSNGNLDSSIMIFVALGMVVLFAVAFFIIRKSKGKKEVEYIYSKEDVEHEKT